MNMRPAELQSKTLSKTRGEEKEVKESGGRGEVREGEEGKEKGPRGGQDNW